MAIAMPASMPQAAVLPDAPIQCATDDGLAHRAGAFAAYAGHRRRGSRFRATGRESKDPPLRVAVIVFAVKIRLEERLLDRSLGGACQEYRLQVPQVLPWPRRHG
jgi:hypothetical protein